MTNTNTTPRQISDLNSTPINHDIKGNPINVFFLDCNRDILNAYLNIYGVPALCEFDAAFYYCMGQEMEVAAIVRLASQLNRDHAEDMASNN